jgi:hypothetical protein
MPVDSIGRCDNTAPWPQHLCTDESSSSKQSARCDDAKGEALRRYRFYLAFENTNEEGYVTEKVYDALDAGTSDTNRLLAVGVTSSQNTLAAIVLQR